MQRIQRTNRATEIRYLQIYEKRMRGWTEIQLMEEFGVSRRTIYYAISYCQKLSLDLTKPEEIELLLDAKRGRIRWIYERIDEVRGGIPWEEYQDTKEGRFVKGGVTIYPAAEASYLREIRELERDIVELKGLVDLKRADEGTTNFFWQNHSFPDNPEVDSEMDDDEMKLVIEQVKKE